jgi:hypothetical protein
MLGIARGWSAWKWSAPITLVRLLAPSTARLPHIRACAETFRLRRCAATGDADLPLSQKK